MKKHGAYVDPGNSKLDSVVLYWMGERVEIEDFNERLMNQLRSAVKDLDWMALGMDLKENINEGHKVVARLDEVEKIARLPLCEACRKLIGEVQ